MGLPVPMGWVLAPGDDPEPLIKFLQHPTLRPGGTPRLWGRLATAAGQYETILNVHTSSALQQAIARCQALRQP